MGKSSAAEGLVDGVNRREEEEDERRSLLPPAAKGGMAGKRKRSGRRKVRWNDCNGKTLVEVLEFHPSIPFRDIYEKLPIDIFGDCFSNCKNNYQP
uniref:Uncharacterized protein LOC105044201 isoform X1 n=1 Tax=Elaeis guineensis var. tenera TaxID=51953 RepID=A0A6I9R648_ELAGV|nr:uncharacterized protein LOC105044201 isoform X1 [Elaeis guineensis]